MDMAKMREHIFILPIIMGKMKVCTLILALSNVSYTTKYVKKIAPFRKGGGGSKKSILGKFLNKSSSFGMFLEMTI